MSSLVWLKSIQKQFSNREQLTNSINPISTQIELKATDDYEHAKALKDFVPDHPHLHELVDKTHQGDMDAKNQFERESLSVRCKCIDSGP